MTLEQVINAYPSSRVMEDLFTIIFCFIGLWGITLFFLLTDPDKPLKRKKETLNATENDSIVSRHSSGIHIMKQAKVLSVYMVVMAILIVSVDIYFESKRIEDWEKEYVQHYIDYGGETVKKAVVDATISKSPIYDDLAILFYSDKEEIIPIRDIKFREEEYTALPYIESTEYEKGFEGFLKQKGLTDKYPLPKDLLIVPKGYFGGTSS